MGAFSSSYRETGKWGGAWLSLLLSTFVYNG